MDAKDLRTNSGVSDQNNDGTKYAQGSATALHCDRNKSYQDIGSNTLGKMDGPTTRPCAVIGPDRIVPPSANDTYIKKSPAEPWSCTDNIYRRPPEYPHKLQNFQSPSRNISPRQTFQENMQRIMVPPTYSSVKINDDATYTQLTERSSSNSKNMKLNVPPDAKYCDVPYAINPTTSNEPKSFRNSDMCLPSVNPVPRTPTNGWPMGSVSLRSTRAFGAPEMYQYPDYPSCAGPRPTLPRPHRTVPEEPSYLYAEPYYAEANIRFKPYPTVKERYPQQRYDYVSNYSNAFHPPPNFSNHKYELPKSVAPSPYPVAYPPIKYLDNRVADSVIEGFQRNPQGNYPLPYRNQIVHHNYGPVIGNCPQNKMQPYPQDPHIKNIAPNKLTYENNAKTYLEYENTRSKMYPPSDGYFINEMSRMHPMKNQVILPNYPTLNMHGIPPTHYYKKDSQQLKNYEYMAHFRGMDPNMNIHNSMSRQPQVFSPNTLAISPTDSNASNDTAQTLMASLEDFGYVSQSSTASIRSMDSTMNRPPNDCYRKYYDHRYPPMSRSAVIGKAETNPNNCKDKKNIDVRQFLQMWNEGDDEGEENSPKQIMIQSVSNDNNNFNKAHEALNKQEQLYVLGLVNVPSEELDKYEHVQKISKLPENIKGYNDIELLNQFEQAIESSKITTYRPPMSKDFQTSIKPQQQITTKQLTGIVPPRPLSPLDVEAKISQSVIHKEVGCNFEIKPCSPKMLNVEMAAPVQTILDERSIEKVMNPVMIKSPAINTMTDKVDCNIIKKQDHRLSSNENDKIRSCNMIGTQFSHNNSPSPTIKTSYSMQDLESNSGLCLASLPQLDNDIELNFPEVNQQFINANKRNSKILTSLKDLPTLEESTDRTAKEEFINLKPLSQDRDINSPISPYFGSDTECTKLSKYRKTKINVSDLKETEVYTNNIRTDSVIIKNPDSVNNYEESSYFDDNSNVRQDVQQVPINLTSHSNNLCNTEKLADSNENSNIFEENKEKILPDMAIDFSVNKNNIDVGIHTASVSYESDSATEKNTSDLFNDDKERTPEKECYKANNVIDINDINEICISRSLKDSECSDDVGNKDTYSPEKDFLDCEKKACTFDNDEIGETDIVSESQNSPFKTFDNEQQNNISSEKCIEEQDNILDKLSNKSNNACEPCLDSCSSNTDFQNSDNIFNGTELQNDDIDVAICKDKMEEDIISDRHDNLLEEITSSQNAIPSNENSQQNIELFKTESDKLDETEKIDDLQKPVYIPNSNFSPPILLIDNVQKMKLDEENNTESQLYKMSPIKTIELNDTYKNKSDFDKVDISSENTRLESHSGDQDSDKADISVENTRLVPHHNYQKQTVLDKASISISNEDTRLEPHFVDQDKTFSDKADILVKNTRLEPNYSYQNETVSDKTDISSKNTRVKSQYGFQNKTEFYKADNSSENIRLEPHDGYQDETFPDKTDIFDEATQVGPHYSCQENIDSNKADNSSQNACLDPHNSYQKEKFSNKADISTKNTCFEPHYAYQDEIVSDKIDICENTCFEQHCDYDDKTDSDKADISSKNTCLEPPHYSCQKETVSNKVDISSENCHLDAPFGTQDKADCDKANISCENTGLDLGCGSQDKVLSDKANISCENTVIGNVKSVGRYLYYCSKKMYSPTIQKLITFIEGNVVGEKHDDIESNNNVLQQNLTATLSNGTTAKNSSLHELDEEIKTHENTIHKTTCNTTNSKRAEKVDKNLLFDDSQNILNNTKSSHQIVDDSYEKFVLHSNIKETTQISDTTMHIDIEDKFSDKKHTIENDADGDVTTPAYRDDVDKLVNKIHRPLKRSLSDSALNTYDVHFEHQDEENVQSVWPFKRRKDNNTLAQKLCNIINMNRRNSVSSIYKEENVSFCILIDNSCIIAEEDNADQEKVCYSELSEDCLIEIQNDDTGGKEAESSILDHDVPGSEEILCEYDSLALGYEEENSIEQSWVEDVACMETIVSDDIAEDIEISNTPSPKDDAMSDIDESEVFSSNDHTDKVKYIYGDMCTNDAQLVDTLFNTPQMDVNKTLNNREMYCSENSDKYYDSDSLENVLSATYETKSLSPPCFVSDFTDSVLTPELIKNNEKVVKQELFQSDDIIDDSPATNLIELDTSTLEENHIVHSLSNNTQDDTVHSCESSIDNVFAYSPKEENECYTSSSPEVSSTTSEEKSSSILLKITNYKGSMISQVNNGRDSNRPSCKFTEDKDYSQSHSNPNRPLLTKAAQKYIPPLKESIRDLKVKLSLPPHSLLKLKQLKLSKGELSKVNKQLPSISKNVKKPKPKFEDVLKSIDEIQFKMHKEKTKKSKKSIPKVVIKKCINGSHYASTSKNIDYNPDMTGRKWQPWVFIEKNNFIDKMAIRKKTKAVYSHRKKTYVLAEKFRKYKSVLNANFVITPPVSDRPSGLKYTIRLKHF